ncbi:MAG: HAD hydrolase family protein, partial [Nitrospiraceae bacterium]
MLKMVLFSDLDGSLLDPLTYSFNAARDALEALRTRRIPLVLATSKTRAEIEPVRLCLDHHD